MPRNTAQLREVDLILRMYLADQGQTSLDQHTESIRSLRNQSPEVAEYVDRVLMEEIGKLRAELKKTKTGLHKAKEYQEHLKHTLAELEEMCKKVTTPPLRLATFMGLRDFGGHPRALVSHEETPLFVNIYDDVNVSALEAGDQVVLSGDLNVLVDNVSLLPLNTGETATFDRYTTDDRVVLSRRDEEIIVNCSGPLRKANLKKGDSVRWSHLFAYEKIERSTGDEFFLDEMPVETFDDVGGLDPQIESLKNMVLMYVEHRDTAAKYGLAPKRSVLLVGPPGNGKTTMAKGLANFMRDLSGSGRARFINIKPSSLGSVWHSQGEANVREVFRAAREAAANDPKIPVVIFFDEVDSIGAVRDSNFHRVDNRMVEAFAVELDGLEARGNIVVVSATNRPDMLDPALVRPGRLADRVVEVPRPNREAARGILSKYFHENLVYGGNGHKKQPAREQILESTLAKLYSSNGDSDVATVQLRDGRTHRVKAQHLVSGARIKSVATEAAERACLREIETGEIGIRLQDVLSVVAEEIGSAASVLTPSNCRYYLPDLPQDVDVVSVESVTNGAARVHRYLDSDWTDEREGQRD
jgi:proteasome-associated ATPase